RIAHVEAANVLLQRESRARAGLSCPALRRRTACGHRLVSRGRLPPMIALALAALSCAAWFYLLTARAGFWRAAQRDDEPMLMASQQSAWPHVVAVIPARDEAELIGGTLAALLNQNYRGAFAVLVVDDHSSDDTPTVVRRAAAAAGASDR